MLLALLFGAHHGPPGERLLSWLGVERPSTVCSVSPCNSSCSLWVGTGALGGWWDHPKAQQLSCWGGALLHRQQCYWRGLAWGQETGWGTQQDGASHAPVLPLLGSTIVVEAQKTAGLPAAALHSDTDNLLDECCCVALEADLQQPDRDLFIEPKEAQDGQDEVFHHICC